MKSIYTKKRQLIDANFLPSGCPPPHTHTRTLLNSGPRHILTGPSRTLPHCDRAGLMSRLRRQTSARGHEAQPERLCCHSCSETPIMKDLNCSSSSITPETVKGGTTDAGSSGRSTHPVAATSRSAGVPSAGEYSVLDLLAGT